MKTYIKPCIVLLLALLLCACGASPKTQGDMNDIPSQHAADPWAAITENGVDEAAFWAALDTSMLATVAEKLQSAVEEELAAEQENPELVLTEGWTRIFQSPQYQDVLALGKEAMPALYWIVYKSEQNGIYEFVCANALYELSGYDFTVADGVRAWDNAKALLPLFNEQRLKEQQDVH